MSQNTLISQTPTDQHTPDQFLTDYSQQVLTIEDIQPTEALTIVSPTSLSDSIINTGKENRDHTIKDFISRPRVVYQGSIPAGGVNNELLLDLKFPDSLLTLEPIREKLKGFQFLRSDIIIKVNFTAPPTVSGSFRGLIIPDMIPSEVTSRTRDLVVTSQFPNKIINIAKMPSLEFTLPWVSPYSHRALMDNLGSNGSFQLRRLFPSSGVVKVIVFASFASDSPNFDLSQPTPALPVFNPTVLSDSNRDILEAISKFTPLQTEKFTKLVRSAGRSKRESSPDIFEAHSLNSVTTQCKHIYNSLSNYFSTVGHPRLVNTVAVARRKLMPAAANINSNEPQISHSFGINSNNFVDTEMGTFGSSVDELAFSHIISHPNYVANFSISASMNYRDVVLALPMDGFAGIIPNFTGPVTVFSDITLTHQAFILNLFENWLASINLNTHLFATQFHSVKLRFVVAPGHYTSNISGLVIDDSNSVVVNFGENSTHETKFPQITNKLFLNNRFELSRRIYGLQPLAADNSFGYFFILIEVPLVLTNDVVSPVVYGMVEQFFSDARFSRPSTIPLAPQNGLLPPPTVRLPPTTTTTTTTTSKPEKEEKVEDQIEIAPLNHSPEPPQNNTRYQLSVEDLQAKQLKEHQNEVLYKLSPFTPPLFAAEVQLFDKVVDSFKAHSVYSDSPNDDSIFGKKFENYHSTNLDPLKFIPPSKDDQFKAHSVYSDSPNVNSTFIQTGNYHAMNLDPPKFNICAYKSASGESITNLRQFLTQFTSPYVQPQPTSRVVAVYNPFPGVEVGNATSATLVDKIDYLLSPFAFTKGGRHVRVYFPDNYTPRNVFAAIANTDSPQRMTTLSVPTLGGRDLHSSRLIPIIPNLEGLADYHFPYYSQFNMQPLNFNPNLPTTYRNPNLEIIIPPNTSFMFSRACAEDVTAGWLCGLPPYLIDVGNVNFVPPVLSN